MEDKYTTKSGSLDVNDPMAMFTASDEALNSIGYERIKIDGASIVRKINDTVDKKAVFEDLYLKGQGSVQLRTSDGFDPSDDHDPKHIKEQIMYDLDEVIVPTSNLPTRENKWDSLKSPSSFDPFNFGDFDDWLYQDYDQLKPSYAGVNKAGDDYHDFVYKKLVELNDGYESLMPPRIMSHYVLGGKMPFTLDVKLDIKHEDPNKYSIADLIRQLEINLAKCNDMDVREQNVSWPNYQERSYNQQLFSPEQYEENTKSVLERLVENTIHKTYVDPEADWDPEYKTISVPFIHMPDPVQANVDMLTQYFRDRIDNTLAEKISSCSSVKEVYDVLKSTRISDLETSAKIKQIKKSMKSMTLDQKKEISTPMKQLLDGRKEQFDLIKGMMSYMRGDSIFEKEADQIRNILGPYYELQEENSIFSHDLYLDGRPDMKFDMDPGSLVGDCTAGKPLPFHRRDTHNIKVRTDPDKDPIGSIYLLETTVEGRKTWHLDAIQIPLRDNWTTTGPSLIKLLGTEAEMKGVEYITINTGSLLISNFDYIDNALAKMPGKEVRAKLPDIQANKHSKFQGQTQKIVWSKE